MNAGRKHTFSEPAQRQALLHRRKKKFSYQAIKVIMLLALTAALTWYIRQGKNNPFEKPNHILIGGDAYACYLALPSDTTLVAVVSPENKLDVNAVAPHGPWTLLSNSLSVMTPSRTDIVPPVEWRLWEQTESKLEYPPGWPHPTSMKPSELRGNITIRKVNDPTLTVPIYEIIARDLICLVVDSRTMNMDTSEISPFRERIDIVISTNTTDSSVLALRNHFRPRYCIALPPNSFTLRGPEYRNILCPSSDTIRFEFTAKNNTVAVDTIQASRPLGG